MLLLRDRQVTLHRQLDLTYFLTIHMFDIRGVWGTVPEGFVVIPFFHGDGSFHSLSFRQAFHYGHVDQNGLFIHDSASRTLHYGMRPECPSVFKHLLRYEYEHFLGCEYEFRKPYRKSGPLSEDALFKTRYPSGRPTNPWIRRPTLRGSRRNPSGSTNAFAAYASRTCCSSSAQRGKARKACTWNPSPNRRLLGRTCRKRPGASATNGGSHQRAWILSSDCQCLG